MWPELKQPGSQLWLHWCGGLWLAVAVLVIVTYFVLIGCDSLVTQVELDWACVHILWCHLWICKWESMMGTCALTMHSNCGDLSFDPTTLKVTWPLIGNMMNVYTNIGDYKMTGSKSGKYIGNANFILDLILQWPLTPRPRKSDTFMSTKFAAWLVIFMPIGLQSRP